MSRTVLPSARAPLGVLVCFSLLGGCIAPHPVDPEIRKEERVEFAEETILSVAPRELLEELAISIERDSRGFEVVDALAFRDTAFPGGGWRLADLLGEPEARLRVAEALEVDYLVLVGAEIKAEFGEEKGGHYVIVPGVLTQEISHWLNAAVIDLRAGTPIAALVSEASGTFRMASYLIYAIGTNPRTRAAVLQGMSDAIIDAIAGHRERSRTRIALLAAEAATEPFRFATPAEPVVVHYEPYGIPTQSAGSSMTGPPTPAGASARNRDKAGAPRMGGSVYSGLEWRDGLYYEIDANTPYAGLRQAHYADGAIAAELEFQDGLEHGRLTIWNRSGSKERELYFREGLREGVETRWYGDGRRRSERHFEAGELHGVQTLWETDGTVSSQICYRRNEIVDQRPEDCLF